MLFTFWNKYIFPTGLNICSLSFAGENKYLNFEEDADLYRNIQNNKNSLQKAEIFFRGGGENCGWLIIEPCSVAITMNLGTSSHGSGVIFTQNPPCFWRHFVDWTKYRSRSSSYYTAQWSLLCGRMLQWHISQFENVVELFHWIFK
jgi:hypothetical protein